MATDYFAAKRAMLAPTTSNTTAATANVTPGNTTVPKAPVGGSPISNGTSNANKAPLAPVTPANTGVTASSTKISPAPTAQITNAALGGTATPSGFGGVTYGQSADANKAITANLTKLNDPNFKNSEISRTLGVIQNRSAQGQDTTDQYRYLNSLGYTAPPSWVTEQATTDISNQIAGYQGQADAAKLAMQSGVNTNNAYLIEALKGLDQSQAVDQNRMEQLLARRGMGFSGGLEHYMTNIGSSYAGQRGGLTRDVAARNQQLIDQYGTQANTIAQQINNLQQAQPGIIQGKINDYLNNQTNRDATIAGLTGMYNGQQTMAGQNQSFNQGITESGVTGMYKGSPTFDRQVTEADLTGMYNGNPTYQAGRDATKDAQWKADFDRIVNQEGIDNALAWAQETRNQNEFEDNSAYRWAGLDADLAAAANQGTKYEGMTANQVIDNVRKNLGDDEGRIPTEQTDAAYLQIINSGLPEDQENQALASIGLTKSQIDALDSKYLSPK